MRGVVTIGAATILSGCGSEVVRWNETIAWGDGGKPRIERSAASAPAARGPIDRKAFKRLQTALKELGYRPGEVDGIIGSQTTMAIKRYQTAYRLQKDGKITWTLIDDIEARIAKHEAAEDAAPILRAGDLPDYESQTTFVYSDGRVERVIGRKGELVRWRRDDETVFMTHRNFMLPWVYWDSDGERGTIKVDQPADTLWPLSKGATVKFLATVTVQRTGGTDPLDEWVEDWRCRNGGRKTIKVRPGTFKTIRFRCTRAKSRSAPGLERVWYYAPSIRHYVRFEERSSGAKSSETSKSGTTRVDLTAIRPGAPSWPPIARAALERAVLNALRKTKNGAHVSWTSSGVGTQVTIRPRSRVVQDDGTPCRAFVQTWSRAGGNRRFPSVACRALDGKWEIPGLEVMPNSTLAISGDLS